LGKIILLINNMNYISKYFKYLIKNQAGGAENDIIQSMIDSVETSVSLKLFSDLKEASYAHIFNTEYTTFLMSQCKDLENFNPIRLTDEPYPIENRPRGQKDLDSVIYFQNKIKENNVTDAIWLAYKNRQYILLDGAHRIAATNLEKKTTIPAFIVRV